MLNDHFRQALIECDVELVQKIWAQAAPHLPRASEEEALIAVHHARTGAESIPFKHRAYSHRWLMERNLPSGLPDKLRPSAERMYPRIVEGVGIAVKTPPERRELGLAIRSAMSDAVMDCYANGDTEPALVKARMMEARAKTYRKLLGATDDVPRPIWDAS